MNKQQLIEAIANEVEVTKATAAACLDAFINTVTKVLKKKGDVRLVGFGTFTTAKRKAGRYETRDTYGEDADAFILDDATFKALVIETFFRPLEETSKDKE